MRVLLVLISDSPDENHFTNSVRYDVRGPVGNAAQPSLSYDASEFGKYLSTLTTPGFMQFALRFIF